MTNDRFRKAIRLRLTNEKGEPLVDTIEELKVLMRIKKFRVKFNEETKKLENLNPTPIQLSFAFKFLLKEKHSELDVDDK